MTNNFLDYYLNGSLVTTMSLPNNVGSSGVGSVFATFGQAVPGTTYGPRGLDGLIDTIAYSTFAGMFSAADNFVLYRAPVAPQLGISGPVNGQITLTWDAVGYVLQENTNLNDTAGWNGLPGTSPVTVNVAPGPRFFRLRQQ
jgi:hypothetical protein